jgi:hypothetical protein
MIATDEIRIAAPELRGAALELGRCRDLEVCLDGPAGTGKTWGALFKIHTLPYQQIPYHGCQPWTS